MLRKQATGLIRVGHFRRTMAMLGVMLAKVLRTRSVVPQSPDCYPMSRYTD